MNICLGAPESLVTPLGHRQSLVTDGRVRTGHFSAAISMRKFWRQDLIALAFRRKANAKVLTLALV